MMKSMVMAQTSTLMMRDIQKAPTREDEHAAAEHQAAQRRADQSAET